MDNIENMDYQISDWDEPDEQEEGKKRSQLGDIWRRLRKNKAAVFGLVVIILFVLMAVFANQIGDYREVAIKQNTAERLQTPNSKHLFGTDAFGRDILARVAHGARVSLSIGFITTFVSLFAACFFGAGVAYWGGLFDTIVMRVCDTLICIPGILLALSIIAALGPGMVNLVIALIIANLPGYIRFIRSVNLTVIEQDFVEAAKAYGASDFRIIFKHILLNAIGPIIVQATMSIAGVIISASGLSFLGMGVQPPRPEWGAMLSDSRDYLRTYPHLMFFPGIAIVLAALSMNLLGDGLRDALDPRLKS